MDIKRCPLPDDGTCLNEDLIEKLCAALRGLLLSADASWEENGLGHDWSEACQAARAVLDKDA